MDEWLQDLGHGSGDVDANEPSRPRRMGAALLRTAGRVVESSVPVGIALLAFGAVTIAAAVILGQNASFCHGSYTSGDPCQRQQAIFVAWTAFAGATGGVLVLLAIPVWVTGAVAKRRREHLQAYGQHAIDRVRDWIRDGATSEATYQEFREAALPLARGTHPALGGRAGAGLLVGLGSVVAGCALLLAVISWAVGTSSPEIGGVIVAILAVTVPLAVGGALAVIVGVAGASVAGVRLRDARHALDDRLDALAVAAAPVKAVRRGRAIVVDQNNP